MSGDAPSRASFARCALGEAGPLIQIKGARAAFKIEAAEEMGDGGLKLGATPDWQGLLGSRTVDPNQWSGPTLRAGM